MRESPEKTAVKIFNEKHPRANCLFLAGSVIRGEATPHSDLDLVILYDKLDCPYRESFTFDGWPIETFVHDFSTFKYFSIKLDKEDGTPSLPQMVSEGIVIPAETKLSQQAKLFANELIKSGPTPLTENQIKLKRYLITDKIDDLRSPRSKDELIATGIQLYSAISDFYFRSKGLWSAEGKMILRKLKTQDPDFQKEFTESFRALFEIGDQSQVIDLAKKVLEPFGGFLFDDFKLDAPKDWRMD